MYEKLYVRGIWIKDQKILLEKCRDTYQLPGGIVIEDEFLKEALIRNFEMKYGIHIEVRRGRVYDVQKMPLQYIYMIRSNNPIIDSSLEWIPLKELEQIPFYDSYIRKELLRHVPSFEIMEDVISIENTEN